MTKKTKNLSAAELRAECDAKAAELAATRERLPELDEKRKALLFDDDNAAVDATEAEIATARRQIERLELLTEELDKRAKEAAEREATEAVARQIAEAVAERDAAVEWVLNKYLEDIGPAIVAGFDKITAADQARRKAIDAAAALGKPELAGGFTDVGRTVANRLGVAHYESLPARAVLPGRGTKRLWPKPFAAPAKAAA